MKWAMILGISLIGKAGLNSFWLIPYISYYMIVKHYKLMDLLLDSVSDALEVLMTICFLLLVGRVGFFLYTETKAFFSKARVRSF